MVTKLYFLTEVTRHRKQFDACRIARPFVSERHTQSWEGRYRPFAALLLAFDQYVRCDFYVDHWLVWYQTAARESRTPPFPRPGTSLRNKSFMIQRLCVLRALKYTISTTILQFAGYGTDKHWRNAGKIKPKSPGKKLNATHNNFVNGPAVCADN